MFERVKKALGWQNEAPFWDIVTAIISTEGCGFDTLPLEKIKEIIDTISKRENPFKTQGNDFQSMPPEQKKAVYRTLVVLQFLYDILNLCAISDD